MLTCLLGIEGTYVYRGGPLTVSSGSPMFGMVSFSRPKRYDFAKIRKKTIGKGIFLVFSCKNLNFAN